MLRLFLASVLRMVLRNLLEHTGYTCEHDGDAIRLFILCIMVMRSTAPPFFMLLHKDPVTEH